MYFAVKAIENPIVGMLIFKGTEQLADKGQLLLVAVLAFEQSLLGDGKEAGLSP